MNRKDRDAKGIAPIQPIENIDAIANYSDLAAWKIKQNRCFNAFLCCRYRRF
jgi:hypothetical protein